MDALEGRTKELEALNALFFTKVRVLESEKLELMKRCEFSSFCFYI
jgi:hypothetical protein